MTTLADDVIRTYQLGERAYYPVIADDIIYAGAAVGNNGANYARPLVAADPFMGFCLEQADNTQAGNSDGSRNVLLKTRGTVQLPFTGLTALDVQKPVYASDDATFTLTAAGNSLIGILREVLSATLGSVDFYAAPRADLAGFQDAIKAELSAFFGNIINTVAWYEQSESATGQPLPIVTPAVVLEIESADEGDDVGDDRTPLLCHLTAYCILGQQTPDLQTQVRAFAAQLFGKVRKNKWGLGAKVGFPGGITLGPGKFDPEATGYDSWFVSWDQTVYLGDSVWLPSGIMPSEIWWNWAPEIGTDFVDSYMRGDI
jgi:hypothetical protein